jgi:hypothetical protein
MPNPKSVEGMALDDTNVYIATSNAIAGGTLTTVAKVAKGQEIKGVALDATNVYWMNAGSGVGDVTLAYLPK